MMDYFDRLAERAVGAGGSVHPLIQPLYALRSDMEDFHAPATGDMRNSIPDHPLVARKTEKPAEALTRHQPERSVPHDRVRTASPARDVPKQIVREVEKPVSAREDPGTTPTGAEPPTRRLEAVQLMSMEDEKERPPRTIVSRVLPAMVRPGPIQAVRSEPQPRRDPGSVLRQRKVIPAVPEERAIHISIGRIEVKAVQLPRSVSRKEQPPPLSLTEYVNRREGR